ncbi:hypothetical protein CBL_11451 [Carabus blaptoides fortunei]
MTRNLITSSERAQHKTFFICSREDTSGAQVTNKQAAAGGLVNRHSEVDSINKRTAAEPSLICILDHGPRALQSRFAAALGSRTSKRCDEKLTHRNVNQSRAHFKRTAC